MGKDLDGALKKRSKPRLTFVDLYLSDPDDNLTLISRFRSRKTAQRALMRPEFLVDLLRTGCRIYMSTVGGKLPGVAKRLPVHDDEDHRCWWRGYARMCDGFPIMLWSLIWPKPDLVDELLDFIIEM